MNNQTGRLSLMLKIEMAAFLLYGLAFLFMPDYTLTFIFGFEESTMPLVGWPQVTGAAFLGIAILGYMTDRHLHERLDMVWGFVAVPLLIMVAYLWQMIADIYVGSQIFFWITIAITAFFVLVVGGLRLTVKTRQTT